MKYTLSSYAATKMKSALEKELPVDIEQNQGYEKKWK